MLFKKFLSVVFTFLILGCVLEAAVFEHGALIFDNGNNFFKRNFQEFIPILNYPEKPKISGNSINKNFLVAKYSPCNTNMVNKIIRRYKDIPGGITLEGSALGIPYVKNVFFVPETGNFVLNNKIDCSFDLSNAELKDIYNSVYDEDTLGVSLGKKDVVYGKLKKSGTCSMVMKIADHYLGAIVFANARWTGKNLFPGNYKLKREHKPEIYAVYFNFYDFQFSLNDSKLLFDSAKMDATLIPLVRDSNNGNGYKPDYPKIERGSFSKAFESNLNHIVSEISVYEQDPRLKRVISFGKAAAFFRKLKESKIKKLEII